MFDLDLEKYTVSELHQLIQVDEPCSLEQIRENSAKLKQSIEHDESLESSKRMDVVVFIDKVIEKLYSHYGHKLPQTYPRGELSDDPAGRSYSVKYPRGEHDPIYRDTVTKIVSIDSKFRRQYYQTEASDFHVTLNAPVKNVVKMSLNAMELPNSIFPISRDLGNNTFEIRDSSENEFSKVEIPNGSYSYNAIVSVLTTYIRQLGGVYADYQVGHSEEPVNARIIIRSSTDGSGNDFEMRFFDGTNPDQNIMSTLGWILGFRLNVYKGNSVYVGEGLYNGGGFQYLLFRVDDFNKNTNDHFISNYTQSILKDNILARIQLQASTFNINYNANSSLISHTREYFGPVSIEKMRIQIMNEYGQLVNLNNMDFSFALELECLR
jgi:hypothetical protein